MSSYQIIKIMQQLPDLKALYQQKYLKATHLSRSHKEVQSEQVNFENFQRINERLSARSLPNKKLSCIRIIKQHSKTFKIDQRPNNLSKTSSNIKTNLSNLNQKRINPQSPNRSKDQLIKKIMKISQQELDDLQSSVGGKKSLIELINLFFQKRHRIHQNNHYALRNTDFKPMQNLFTRRCKEDEDKYQQYRIHRKQPSSKLSQRVRQKDLAPWSVQDIQFS